VGRGRLPAGAAVGTGPLPAGAGPPGDGRLDEALAALRRSVFLDPGAALAQVALAELLGRLGEPARARSALRAAAALLGDGDPAEPVPGHDELTVGRVRDLVAARLARLDADPEAAR
jgi:tetratricopeptide (TPR) repeat protein